jgi:ABC-type glucose/galactose transport system permease subunit
MIVTFALVAKLHPEEVEEEAAVVTMVVVEVAAAVETVEEVAEVVVVSKNHLPLTSFINKAVIHYKIASLFLGFREEDSKIYKYIYY